MGYISLKWQAAVNAGTYTLFRDGVRYKTGLTTTSFKDMDATPGQVYTYIVAAISKNGAEAVRSKPVSSTAPASGGGESCAPVTTPTNLRVEGKWVTAAKPTDEYGTDVLTWDAVPGAVGYNVYRYDVLIGKKIVGASWEVPKATFRGGLTYAVTAVDGMGMESIPSNIVMAQGAANPRSKPGWQPTAPGAAYALAVAPEWNNNAPRACLTWQAGQLAWTYNVYRDGKKIASGVWGQTYMDTDVKPGASYKYTVSSVNVPWTTPVESAQSAVTAATMLTKAPTGGGTVTVTGVKPNDDSVMVYFAAVPGALDYRAYTTSNPGSMKYSGGGLSIEMNGLKPGQPEQIVVEAVDKMGPFQKMDGDMGPGSMTMAGMSMAINGQGDPSNVPNVLAASPAFSVAAQSTRRMAGSQVFFDTFRDSQPFASAPVPASLTAANGKEVGAVQNDKWIIYNVLGDLTNTKVFVMGNHFMETLYDGGTPDKGGNALHTQYASIVMQPKATADISGGRVLHATFEVDGHFGGRRWCDVLVTEAGDPLAHPGRFMWYGLLPTTSGKSFFWQIQRGQHFAHLTDKASGDKLTTVSLINDPDQYRTAGRIAWNGKPLFNGTTQDLDKRHRFDLYLSQTRFRVYEDGQLIKEATFPAGKGLSFSRAQVYFLHSVYHTSLEREETILYMPQEKYWINHRPLADERHWDNMGFEVLDAFPATVSE